MRQRSLTVDVARVLPLEQAAEGLAAMAAGQPEARSYPGGTVDRVVLLSSGDYEVHIIAANWPHHVFVNKDFNVIGAE